MESLRDVNFVISFFFFDFFFNLILCFFLQSLLFYICAFLFFSYLSLCVLFANKTLTLRQHANIQPHTQTQCHIYIRLFFVFVFVTVLYTPCYNDILCDVTTLNATEAMLGYVLTNNSNCETVSLFDDNVTPVSDCYVLIF